jgi:hypothetical protein
MSKEVYVVHCIDTEGPLYESLDETFKRIDRAVGVDLEPSRATLSKLQSGDHDFFDDDKKAVVKTAFSPLLLAYNDTWDKVDNMLFDMMSDKYRKDFADSDGNGWIYNWFILDHVGFEVNPRRRDMGYHNIYDHFRQMIGETDSHQDEVEWHFHPMSTHKEAHTCATSFINSPHLLQTLTRRVIDRHWFPTCFRAGFHAERPDSHWFLEQWLPYDFSNQAMQATKLDTMQRDLSSGRFGDWRRAPDDWSHYHPSHDDYQSEGHCNRVIFRCLNVGTRLRLITQQEVDKAFARADSGEPTIVAFTNHDFRDMRPDVETVHAMLEIAAKKYPDVKWKHSGAKQAAKKVLGHKSNNEEVTIDVNLENDNGIPRLVVKSSHDSFGPQPFLAIKTHDKRYVSDNFDLQAPNRCWTYTFDDQSIAMSVVESIGIAVTLRNGDCHVINMSPSGEISKRTIYN